MAKKLEGGRQTSPPPSLLRVNIILELFTSEVTFAKRPMENMIILAFAIINFALLLSKKIINDRTNVRKLSFSTL